MKPNASGNNLVERFSILQFSIEIPFAILSSIRHSALTSATCCNKKRKLAVNAQPHTSRIARHVYLKNSSLYREVFINRKAVKMLTKIPAFGVNFFFLSFNLLKQDLPLQNNYVLVRIQ